MKILVGTNIVVHFKHLGLAIAGSLLLAACGETAFQDAFNAGKYSPDETKVRSGQPLTTPPDLQLRPPSGAAPQQPVVASRAPVQTTPPQYGTPQQPQYGAAPQQPQYGTAPQQPRQAYVPPANGQPAYGQPPAAANQRPDAFTKNGISHYKADGTKKTRQEMLAELRTKKLAEQKKNNPNYGTVFNLPKWFKDNQT